VPENIIKPVHYQVEIITWLDECIKLIEAKLSDKYTDLVMNEDALSIYFYIKQYRDFWGRNMTHEILDQVNEHFSDREKWFSFSELARQKDIITNSWWQSFMSQMNKCFMLDNVVDGWGYRTFDKYHYRWFLDDFGHDSLCLMLDGWGDSYSLLLRVQPKEYDSMAITKLLQTPKYAPIISAFERIDKVAADEWVQIAELGNFKFGDVMDWHFDKDRIVWYAYHQTDSLSNKS